jgi:hypothetical protein
MGDTLKNNKAYSVPPGVKNFNPKITSKPIAMRLKKNDSFAPALSFVSLVMRINADNGIRYPILVGGG